MANIFGNGLIGRVDVNYISKKGWMTDDAGNRVMYFYTERSDNRNYYLKDHLGSNRMTINSLGVVTNVQDYYAYGEVLRSYNNSTPNEKYKFTGKERDTETGLDYFGARFYDSELGRWTSIDPLADSHAGWSPYTYCLNRPLNLIYPTGLDEWDPDLGYVMSENVTIYWKKNWLSPKVKQSDNPDNEKGPIQTVALSGSFVIGWGFNWELGYNYNEKNGYCNIFAKWGDSFGFNVGPSIEYNYYQNYSLKETNGSGAKIDGSPGANTWEIEGGIPKWPSANRTLDQGTNIVRATGANYGPLSMFSFSANGTRQTVSSPPLRIYIWFPYVVLY